MQASNQISVIIATLTDENEINLLTQKIYEILENLYGGRITNQYYSEIRYITSVLYISLNTISHASTVGQDFCGLKLFELLSSLPSTSISTSSLYSIPTYFNSLLHNNVNKSKFQNLTVETCLIYSLLYGLANYTESRLDSIISITQEVYNTLFTNNTNTNNNNNAITTISQSQNHGRVVSKNHNRIIHINSNNPTSEASNTTTTITSANNIFTKLQQKCEQYLDNILEFNYSKYFYLCIHSLLSLYTALGDNTTARAVFLKSILSTCHDCLYYNSPGHARFPSFSTRVANIHHLTFIPSIVPMRASHDDDDAAVRSSVPSAAAEVNVSQASVATEVGVFILLLYCYAYIFFLIYISYCLNYIPADLTD